MLERRSQPPRRPLHQCSAEGCRTLTRDRRCSKHAKTHAPANHKPGDPFYSGKRWIKLRNAKRADQPLCERCLAEGRVSSTEHVHHVKPRKDFPELAFDWDNLQGLCHSCHSKATAKEKGAAGRS